PALDRPGSPHDPPQATPATGIVLGSVRFWELAVHYARGDVRLRDVFHAGDCLRSDTRHSVVVARCDDYGDRSRTMLAAARRARRSRRFPQAVRRGLNARLCRCYDDAV